MASVLSRYGAVKVAEKNCIVCVFIVLLMIDLNFCARNATEHIYMLGLVILLTSSHAGPDHEKTALETYENQQKSLHSKFSVSCSGSITDPSYPHMGASPDGLVV